MRCRFASRGGFYAAFVALSDPARVVYAMGTVDDDANGGDASPQLVEIASYAPSLLASSTTPAVEKDVEGSRIRSP